MIGHDVDIIGGKAGGLELVGEILRLFRHAVTADHRRQVDDMFEFLVSRGALG